MIIYVSKPATNHHQTPMAGTTSLWENEDSRVRSSILLVGENLAQPVAPVTPPPSYNTIIGMLSIIILFIVLFALCSSLSSSTLIIIIIIIVTITIIIVIMVIFLH